MANPGQKARIYVVAGVNGAGKSSIMGSMQGGHPIPEPIIRQRYHRSRVNLIRLVPHLTELMVYDNSREADPWAGLAPEPLLVLHMKRGSIVRTCDFPAAPAWTKPILMAAFRCVPKQ